MYSTYTGKKLRAIGALKYVEWSKRRVGLLLGGLLCVCMVLVSEQFVFSIELTGTQAYAREVKMALEEAGIRPFFPYQTGKEDLICANLLAIEDVEYCSVRKIGHRVIVELRTSPFSQMQKNDNVMQAKHSGTLAAMTVLRGTPFKKIGESVVEGEPLVGNWLQMEAGGQVRVEIIARVRIACVWEGTIEAESEEEAFAKTFLLLGLADGHKMTDKEIVEHDGLYRVKIAYEAIETLNF